MTKVAWQTPAASSLARAACGTVFVTASPSSSRPKLSFPTVTVVPRTAAAHTATQGVGRRRSRRPTTTAIIVHSAAPIPDDQAASTRPAPAAYSVQPAQEMPE